MRLSRQEQQIVQEAEESRGRAMQAIEHGTDLVITAQLIAAAGELYLEAAALVVVRAKREARAARPGKVSTP